MVPTYSVFAEAINKAVKGTLHFSHIYLNRELKAFEEHLLIKCYNRFVKHPDRSVCIFQNRQREVYWPGFLWVLLTRMIGFWKQYVAQVSHFLAGW